MDALILSCGTGGGHDSAARAMREALERRGHRATLLNPYALIGPKVEQGVNRAYISLVQKATPAFGLAYAAGEAVRRLPLPSPVYAANSLATEPMAEYLRQHPCDVAVMTHLFPAEIFTWLERHGAPVPKWMLIATDYVCIPFMEECDCDAFVIPAEVLRGNFEARGIPRERIHPLGIPVSSAFSAPISKSEARLALGLDADEPIILVSGGSIGVGQIERILSYLMEEAGQARLIVICGNNDALRRRLSERWGERAQIIGTTDRMALYMRAADLVMTKPGGLSSTEAAVTGVPLMHLPAIPGCEPYNVRFFMEHGMSVPIRATRKSVREALALIASPEAREAMVACQRDTMPRDAADSIARLAERLAE